MTDTAQTEVPGAWRVGTWVKEKYLLESVLGSGGMATVYAARHRNKKRFAVKMLHPELSKRADVRARFLREGYVGNTVDHPGAVAVLDDDVAEDGAAFLVMELLDGGSLEAIAEARGGRLPLEAVLAIAYQALDVLAAAHRRKVVHRDIKPANLFVTRDGRVKVLDYGIARLHEGDASSTRTGAAMGTPAFMAPEQAAGRMSLVDGQSDVWSLGATMFSLITGTMVHMGETPQHIMVLNATQPPHSILETSPDLPHLASAVIDRALAFDKAARWPSAASMREALGRTFTALFDGSIEDVSLGELAGSSALEPSHAPTVMSAGVAQRPGVLTASIPIDENIPSVRVPAVASSAVSHPNTERPVSSRSTPAPRRPVPLWIGGIALVVIAGALVLRQRASLSTSAPPVGSDSPPVLAETGAPAAPPPTGAAAETPTPSAEPTVSIPRPASVAPSARPATPTQARPVRKPPPTQAPGAPTAGPTDFDRQ